MAITWLDPVDPEVLPADLVAERGRHPMRAVTHAAAAEVGAWEGDVPRQVREAFDHLADEWHTHHLPERLEPLRDAVARGGPLPMDRPWLELGCGDGWVTSTIAGMAPQRDGRPDLVSMDLSLAMLRLATPGPYVQADASRLPLDDHAIGVAVLMNMLLFPIELDRVLAPGGVLVWLSSRGEATPIHLTPEQVAAALPGRWGGVAARHGPATWGVLRRLG